MTTNINNVFTIGDFCVSCRLCFGRDCQLTNIFSPSSNLLEKIGNCLGISIVPDEHPATSVCLRCVMLIDQFHDFKQLCQAYNQLFHNTIRNRPAMVQMPAQSGACSSDPNKLLVEIKSESIDGIELEPLEIVNEFIKEEPDTVEVEDQEDPSEYTNYGEASSSSKSPAGITVRMIFNQNRMYCTKVFPSGTMQWTCCSYDCGVSFSSSYDGTLELRSIGTHNHPPQIESSGLIHCAASGHMERYALRSTKDPDVLKLTWNEHDWDIRLNHAGERIAVCSEHTELNCPKYLKILGDFQELHEEFEEHNHHKNLIFFRNDVNPSECEQNPWALFCRVDPCRLSLGCETQMPLRIKLFHNRIQYRLFDCSWNGNSRWRCDTVSCRSLLTLNDSGTITSVKKHNHEPQIDRQGAFNGAYYCSMTDTKGGKKLFYNAHCYRWKNAGNWVCAVHGCCSKLQLGENYEYFATKGTHSHGGYRAVIIPSKSQAIYLPSENSTLPPSIVIDDVQNAPVSTKIVKPKVSEIVQPKKVEEVIKIPVKRGRKIKFNDLDSSQPDDGECMYTIRMIYDGHRYTLCEFYPDGTSYWRCWGQRCKKSVHMTPTGSIYSKNKSIEHTHKPTVTRFGQVAHENGQVESYAVYKDAGCNTTLMYRNALWNLVPGEGSHIASCKELQGFGVNRKACGAKIRIFENFSRFVHTGECVDHSEQMLIFRSSSECIEGDPALWKMYQEKYPLYLSDGSIFPGGRHCHLFIGGFRYTMQGLLWSGSSIWRCAVQTCTVKGRIFQNGRFVSPEHKHEKPEHLQGTIWNEKRQRDERYFVAITLKKTIATLHYNTYCYALRDEQRNIWVCYPGLCNASLRIEGDFLRVVDEVEHTHDGTLTIVRSDATTDTQECYAPTKGCSRKRPEGTDETQSKYTQPKMSSLEDPPITGSRPKFEGILHVLEKRSSKSDVKFQVKGVLSYHGGFTYSRSTLQDDGNTRYDCYTFRCPGRIILSLEHFVVSRDEHTHSKSYDACGTIRDVTTGQSFQYILVNGRQKRNVTFFVCHGFRYNILSKAYNLSSESEWQCVKCDVKITITESFSCIEFSSVHNHEPTDKIIPTKEEEAKSLDSSSSQPTTYAQHFDEVVWGNHRYNTPIHIRRLNRIKWMCFKGKNCKSYLYQHTDGSFEDMEPHNHDGPIEVCGEISFDETLKMKDRYAILKGGARPKLRQLIFQNQKYHEKNQNIWVCCRKSCNGSLKASGKFDSLEIMEDHSHPAAVILIKFHDEIQSCSGQRW